MTVVCVCVCVCVCTRTGEYVQTHGCIIKGACVHTYIVCARVYTCLCVYVSMRVYVFMYVHMCIRSRVCGCDLSKSEAGLVYRQHLLGVGVRVGARRTLCSVFHRQHMHVHIHTCISRIPLSKP